MRISPHRPVADLNDTTINNGTRGRGLERPGDGDGDGGWGVRQRGEGEGDAEAEGDESGAALAPTAPRQRVYPASDLLWGRGLSCRNGRCRTGDGAVSQFDCRVFFSDSPLKNMMDGNLVFPVPPDDIIKNRAQPTF